MKAESKLESVGDLRLTTSRLTRSPQGVTPSVSLRPALRTELRSAPKPSAEYFMNRSFDNGRVRAPTSEPSSKRLLERISELERLRKLDQQRVLSLEEQVSTLEAELDRVRSLSMQALEDQKGSDLHGLYHELFLTDLRKQVDSVNREASAYRWQFEEHKKELEGLRRECHQQKVLLKRYREYVADAYGKQTTRTQLIMDSTSGLSETSGEVQDSRRMSLTGRQQFLSASNTQSSLQLRFSRIQCLEESLTALNDSKGLHSLCSALQSSTRKLAQCQQVAIYIIDPASSSLYNKGKSPHQVYKFVIGGTTITQHCEGNSDSQNPTFKSIHDAQRGIRNSDLMVMPVVTDGRLIMVVQCAQKIDGKHRSGFAQSDEVLMRILCSFVALHVETFEAKEQEALHKSHVKRVTHLCTRLLAARSHQHFANRLREELPEFMDFEHAGVVFYDSQAGQFFALTSNSENMFSDEVIRFPVNIGLTGEVFTTGKTMVMDSSMKSQRYNPEIDNAAGAPETRNLMLGCLKTEGGNIVGVLQVSNKRNHGKILEDDKSKLESVLRLIAGIIENCTETLTCMEVTTSIRSYIQRVSRSVAETDEMRKDLDLSVILNQFAAIRNIMGSFSERHAG